MSIHLQEVIDHLYALTVVEGKKTSTLRLLKLQEYCIEQLALVGLNGATKEKEVPGGGRPKRWDVAWEYHKKVRLAISLKSILQNLPGAVPNRIDDLMGEVTNAQMYSPEITIGYIIVIDTSKDDPHGKWVSLLENRLSALSGRALPAFSTGTIEAYRLIRVDFSHRSHLITSEAEVTQFFETLAYEVRQRNPSLNP